MSRILKARRMVAWILLVVCLFSCAFAEGEWTCAGCGVENGSAFCGNCGMSREASAEIVICPGCGAQSAASDGHRFCASCGTELGERCGHCGAKLFNPEMARFCGECGASLAPVVPTVEPVPTAATSEQLPLRPTSQLYYWYDESTRYYYHQLSDAEKQLFSLLYDGFVRFEERIEIPDGFTLDMNKRVWFALRLDCPELFQLNESSYEYYGERLLAVKAKYLMSEAEYARQWAEISAIIVGMQSLPGFGASDFSKQLVIYRYIIENCSYLIQEPYTINADAVYLLGQAQCCGYTRGMNLALRYYGIPCLEVTGFADSGGGLGRQSHAWTIAQIDGEWYHSDLTWDDADLSSMGLPPEEMPPRFPENGNAYVVHLNVSDPMILRHHEIVLEEAFELPVCTAFQSNYAYQNGIYVLSGQPEMLSHVQNGLISLENRGLKNVIILFESDAEYIACRDNMKEQVLASMPGGDYRWWWEDNMRYIYVFLP